MPLSRKEKLRRRRNQELDYAKKFRLQTYRGKVATTFQTMIRAEYGAIVEPVSFYCYGGVQTRSIISGFCACITCGRQYAWKGSNQLDCGHGIPGRKNAILFEERIVAPQCVACNRAGGEVKRYELVVDHVHGPGTYEEIEARKRDPTPISRDQLIDMRIEYLGRLSIAQERM